MLTSAIPGEVLIGGLEQKILFSLHVVGQWCPLETQKRYPKEHLNMIIIYPMFR